MGCLIAIVLLLNYGNTFASTPEEQFNLANKKYRSGLYDIAAKEYESLISSGFKSSQIYFNLGNCFYKQQEFSKAIVNYERAKRLNPLDEDINYNLKLAYSNTIDKIEPVPLLFYQRWWNGFIFTLSPDEWSSLAIILIWTSLLLGIWYLFATSVSSRKTSFLSGSIVLLISLFVFFIASRSYKKIYDQKNAIVITPNAYIRSSPDTKSTNLFMLHEGTKIDVVDELSGWKQIRIANGNVGWIESNALEVI